MSRISDIQSFLSDMNSDLRSFMTVTGVAIDSATMSDIRSAIAGGAAATITASDISDIASAVWNMKYTAASNVKPSTFGSALRLNMSRISDTYSMVSDFYSDFQSRVPKRVATDSQLSDLQSDLKSLLLLVASNVSDTYSLLSDHHSDFQSRVPKRVATDSQLSDLHSDLRSLIGGITATISASDMSDIASRVWTEKYTAASNVKASSFGSALRLTMSRVSDLQSDLSDARSDLKSLLLLVASNVSDTYSLLSDFQSDFQSRVPKRVATDSQLSDLQSDLRSYLVVMSGILSDTYSLLSDHHSDFQSRVPKRVATDSQLSDLHSDLRSQIGGITASISASDMSDIASRVWAEKYTAASNVKASTFGSALRLNMSRISDIQSQVSDAHSDLRSFLVVMSGILSDTYSLLSDHHSDFQSRVPKAVATNSQLSDLASDLKSYMVGLSDSISNISARIPTTLSSGRLRVDVEAVNASTTAAANLALSAGVMIAGAAFTGTLSTTQMTTNLTEATNDHYKGRIIIWTSGTLLGQATDITAYLGSTKMFTYTATTEAPLNGDTFIVV